MESQQPGITAKLRKIAGALLMTLAVIYFIWGSWAALGYSGFSRAGLAGFLALMLPVLLLGSPTFALGRLLWSSWKPGKWISRFGITALAATLGSFLWPVRTRVTADTRIRVVREDGMPFVGLRAEQEWGMYGYYDRGGTDIGTTDATGTVHFPPRYAKGSVGLRLLRRLALFAFYKLDVRSGPIAGVQIGLPVGYWLPAEWSPAKSKEEANSSSSYGGNSLSSPIFGNRLHEYFYIYNIGMHHPGAYIGGNEGGFMDDSEIKLALRPANSFEEKVIRQQEEREQGRE